MNHAKLADWEAYYRSLKSLMFPNEYVVRAFTGSYPNLSLDKCFAGKRICDVSCGDGRNLVLLHRLGFDVSGTEVTDGTCENARSNLLLQGIHADIRPGTNERLPFEDGSFDYLLSWNAAYYMASEKADIKAHVAEYARILKPGGVLVASVPAPGCYSLLGAKPAGGALGNGVWRLDPALNAWAGGLMKDSLFYRFQDFAHIELTWGDWFKDFSRGTLKDDCFGMPLEYFLFACIRRR